MRYSRKVTPTTKLHLSLSATVTCVTSVTLNCKSACRAISQKLHLSLSLSKYSNFCNLSNLKIKAKLQLVTRCNFYRLACRAALNHVGYSSYSSYTRVGSNYCNHFPAECEVK